MLAKKASKQQKSIKQLNKHEISTEEQAHIQLYIHSTLKHANQTRRERLCKKRKIHCNQDMQKCENLMLSICQIVLCKKNVKNIYFLLIVVVVVVVFVAKRRKKLIAASSLP